jgi:flagellar basal-body rod protein FlgC
MFEILDIGASGLTAQRVRMDTIAANIANANTTHGPNGEKTPFRRRLVTFAQGQPGNASRPGVHVEKIEEDQSAFRPKFEPGNKDADKNGYVYYPNIDPVMEFTNAIDASRAYEANATMIETAKSMFNSTLRLLA